MYAKLRPLGHFVRHLLEMCLVMCLGMAVLDALFFGIARVIGYSEPLVQLPELSTLVVAFNMAAPMLAWMRFRGHEWRPIWEMSGAMFVEAIALLGAFWLGFIAAGESLFGWQHALMMPAMIIPMLFRLDLYTGRAGHPADAQQPSARFEAAVPR
jgi:hypothetical protein